MSSATTSFFADQMTSFLLLKHTRRFAPVGYAYVLMVVSPVTLGVVSMKRSYRVGNEDETDPWWMRINSTPLSHGRRGDLQLQMSSDLIVGERIHGWGWAVHNTAKRQCGQHRVHMVTQET
ncbi:hypothetical protein Pelo_19025 [Pelomyxa schiedti]|nr:hypothetical protein Pelo_19025 [Pelomyxa schiedti]